VTLHPDSQEVLEHLERWGPPHTLSIATMRAREQWRFEELAAPSRPVAEVASLSIPGPAGEIPARLYRPTEDAATGVLVWLHGGGFVSGSPAWSDDVARSLALESDCVVVSVDYRLAPEHPFPAAPEDCFAAVRWIAAQRDGLGAAGPGLAIGGDSAGGNLAAAVTLMARDRGGPPVDFQLLFYPPTSMNIDTASRRAFGEGYGLSVTAGESRPHYLRDLSDATDPTASPLLAERLSGLPPGLLVTAEYDPLRDEGEMYARRLVAAGVPCEIRRYDGMVHGFLAFGRVVRQSADALRYAGRAVRETLERERSMG
jgi:acetyl esterase